VLLHQADFLEHPSIQDVVILSTVYQEVNHKNSSVFSRLKDMLRSKEKRFYYFSNEFHKVCTQNVPQASAGKLEAFCICTGLLTGHVRSGGQG
jgi:hypothetical protein